jgi:hypothetical protein
MKTLGVVLLMLSQVPAGSAQTHLHCKDTSATSASIVAGVASASGAGGARYVSSLSLANPHPFPLSVTAYLMPAGSDNTSYRASARVIDLPAGGGTRIEDPLVSLWGTSGLAAVYLEAAPISGSDNSFSVDSRVLNVANPSATFGLSLPGTSVGVTADDVGLAPDIQNDAAYRTNVGLFNDWSEATTVSVELLGDDGAVLGSKSYALLPYSLQQTAVSDVVSAPFQHAVLRITPADGYGGQIIGYTSVVNNATGDGAAGMLQTYRVPDAEKATEIPLLVTMTRYQFSPGGPAGPPIRLQAGRIYRITFQSVDVEHGISGVSQLGIENRAVVPGADYVVRVAPTDSQRGSYNFACNRVCGGGHGGMYGSIEVE